jgi:FkbM family methyltransferase
MTGAESRARVRARLKRLARKARLEVSPYDVSTSPDARRSRVIEAAGVNLVLDVGANAGQYARHLRQTGYRGRIVSFEPLSEAFGALAAAADGDPRWETRRVAVGNQAGVVEMNVAGDLQSSSVLPMEGTFVPGAPGSGYVATEEVPVVRLDDLEAELRSDGDRVLLKLDVQGFEEQALAGATELLRETSVVEVEMSLVPLYTGQALFRDVIERLETAGFELWGITPGYADPKSGRVLQVDGLFVRAGERFSQ